MFKLKAEDIKLKMQLIFGEHKYTGRWVEISNVSFTNNPYLTMYYNETDYIGFTFKISGNFIFLYFSSSNSKVQLNKGDEILFHFDSGDTLIFNFHMGNTKMGSNNVNFFVPEISSLQVFLLHGIEYWRLTKVNGIILEGRNDFFPETNRFINADDFNEVMNYAVNMIAAEFSKKRLM